MNHVAGKIAVGAPKSQARYENANRICANCLSDLNKSGNTETHYKALVVGGAPAIVKTQCYVCESYQVCAIVEAIL